MKRAIFRRLLSVFLVLALVLGAVTAVRMWDRTEPENPISATAAQLQAESAAGLSGGSQSFADPAAEAAAGETEDTEAPGEESQEPEESPEEDPEESAEKEPEDENSRQNPEDAQTPENPQEPQNPSGGQETQIPSGGQETQNPSGGGEGETPAEPSGEGTEGGGSEPGGVLHPEGPEDPETPEGPVDPADPEEPYILTSLQRRQTIYETSHPEPAFTFTAEVANGTGKERLSVRWQLRDGDTAKSIRPANGNAYSVNLIKGKTIQVNIVLWSENKILQNKSYMLTYEAERASADNPVIGGSYAPSIVTNMDGYYEDGDVIETESFIFRVTARKMPGGEAIHSNQIAVYLNGVEIQRQSGVSDPEYELFFERGNIGDYRDYRIEVVAWDGENSRYWSKTIRYHAVDEGGVIGTATIMMDATTVGLGIFESGQVELRQGDTAADTLLAFLEEYGYDSVYDGSSKSNFYLRRISRGDLCGAAQVPDNLWEMILRDGIALSGQQDWDSLGEYDYTMGSGWMYAVNGSYPGRGMDAWRLSNGDTLTLRFTLSWGKDINGYGTTGGSYGSLSSYCGVWINGGYQQLEHSYEETARQEPTEAEDGYIEYTCTKCRNMTRELLPKLEHTHSYEETARQEPTETEDGWIEYTCTVCGDTYRDPLPKLEHTHSYVETARQEPTETEDGWIEYTCTVCGDTHREILPATGPVKPEPDD